MLKRVKIKPAQNKVSKFLIYALLGVKIENIRLGECPVSSLLFLFVVSLCSPNERQAQSPNNPGRSVFSPPWSKFKDSWALN